MCTSHLLPDRARVPVEDVLEDVRLGRPVALIDDVRRSGEGTLIVASDFVTAETIAFLATQGRGLICLCLTAERCEELGLEPMTSSNGSSLKSDFRVAIEAREGVSTGISAADRARTVRVATDPAKGRRDLVSPGHMFPLRAQPGGVLRRPGRTEAAVDLARLAGATPAAVVCELLNVDGTVARNSEVTSWCDAHGFRHAAISDLLEYRRRNEQLVERVSSSLLSTAFGEFAAIAYHETFTNRRHVALVRGDATAVPAGLVSVHVACLAGNVFQSLGCACGAELESALRRIAAAEHGVLLYLDEDDENQLCGSVSSTEAMQGYVTYQILSELSQSEIRLFDDSESAVVAPAVAAAR
jgi:3,4-dihydroxy 2-butanone 4-phosphate synthase/GTP cyclohydrolase II